MNYDETVRRVWRHTEGAIADDAARLRELVRYATLAASAHNTQCWRFRIGGDTIRILPDWSRRTPVVDPDDHHLHVSLGCAAENLALAARAFGLAAEAEFRPDGEGEVRIALAPCAPERSPSFEAIPSRQCTRSAYDGKPLAREELQRLEAAGSGRGVSVVLLTERAAMEQVLEHVVRGNTMQVENPAFRRELEDWIRFGDAEAIESGDGLTARVTGNPRTPRWLGRWLFRATFRAGTENDKVARHIRSSAGIAVFVSRSDDRAHWVEAGRCYQRFALQATVLGVRNAFVNQPVEEAGLRPAFAEALGLGDGRPDLVVRFGRGPEMASSLRRPIDAVLLPEPEG